MASESRHALAHQRLERHLSAAFSCVFSPLVVRVLLVALRGELIEHMRTEERHLYPRLDDTRLLERDHSLLRDRLHRVEEIAVDAAVGRARPAMLRHALAGLDALLEHHDQRETLAYEGLDLERLPFAGQEPLTIEQAEVLASERTLQQLAARLRRLDELYEAKAMPSSGLGAVEAEPALSKLVSRDDGVVAAYLAVPCTNLRRRAAHERRAQETLRSTLGYHLRTRLEGIARA